MAPGQRDRLLQGDTQSAAAMGDRGQLSASGDLLKITAFKSIIFKKKNYK